MTDLSRTQHSAERNHPLKLAVGPSGGAIHVCAACGAEIPDGVAVRRERKGVVAWSPSGPDSGPDDSDIFHDCRGG